MVWICSDSNLTIRTGRAQRAWFPPRGAVRQEHKRLLRYEASLDRSFARTLDQLERLQRMRRGQPAPPSVIVEINVFGASAVLCEECAGSTAQIEFVGNTIVRH